MTVKPFLKWVGGKRQLMADIAPLVPNEFSRYIEPFVGGGAVFFHLSGQINAHILCVKAVTIRFVALTSTTYCSSPRVKH